MKIDQHLLIFCNKNNCQTSATIYFQSFEGFDGLVRHKDWQT